MAVEVYAEPRSGQVSVDVHSYDSDRDVYTISVGGTAGVEVPASAIVVESEFEDYDPELDDYDDWFEDYLGGYEG